jgi:hypothetical protein
LLSGCKDSKPPLVATLTFKADGTHFTGTVVRREPASITVTGPAGDAHTFLYTELSDIRYGSSGDTKAGSTVGSLNSDSDNSGAAFAAARGAGGDVIQLPAGIRIRVTNRGVIDSTFFPIGTIALGSVDADVKSADGKVLIPAGASVTVTLRDERRASGRTEMDFEIGSLDFSNHHYLVSSAKGSQEKGAVVTILSAEPGTAAAKYREGAIHLDDHALMDFRTESPTLLKVSE